MSSQKVARDAFMKTIGQVAASKAMEPIVQMATDTLGAYFGQRSEGPTGPTPRDIEVDGKVVGRESTGFGGAARDYAYSLMTERGPARGTKEAAEADSLNSAKYGRKRPTEPSIGQDSETGNIVIMQIIQKILNDKKDFIRAWQLNERHYGALTGLNKIEMGKKIGEDKVYEFRRSWDSKPEALNKGSPYHPINISTYKSII